MTLSGFQYGTKPKGMQAKVKRLRSKQAGDKTHALSSSKITMNTCCWRKCKIIMDGKNKNHEISSINLTKIEGIIIAYIISCIEF